MRLRSIIIFFITLLLIGIIDFCIRQIQVPVEPRQIQDQAFNLSRISSSGEQILVGSEALSCRDWEVFDAHRKRGAASMSAKKISDAIDNYQKALEKCPNAPETLIYLNNAKIEAELQSKKRAPNQVYTLAISVPITGSDPGKASMMLRGFSQAQTEALYLPETLYPAEGMSSKYEEFKQDTNISKINSTIFENIKKTHEQPLKGKLVRLKIIDDSDKPKVAEQIARSVLADTDILAVAGHWTSATSLAAAEIYKYAQTMVFITPISISDKLKDLTGHVFRTNAVGDEGSRVLVDYIKNTLKKTKVAIFFDGENKEYCVELKNKIIKSIGNDPLEYDLAQPNLDIPSALAKIKSSFKEKGPALVLIPAAWSTNKALQIVAENERSNYEFSLIGDMSNLYTLTSLQVGGPSAAGMVLAPAWNNYLYKDSTFARRSFALWKAEVNFASALSYNAAEALIQALKTQPTRVGIRRELSNKDFSVEGSMGSFKFSEFGDAATKSQLVQICPVQNDPAGIGVNFKPIGQC